MCAETAACGVALKDHLQCVQEGHQMAEALLPSMQTHFPPPLQIPVPPFTCEKGANKKVVGTRRGASFLFLLFAYA